MIPENVNQSQWQAITHEGSHLLIVAGPGTGKTHTLTQRVAHWRVKYPEQKILAITFTKKAAEEMRKRLGEKDGVTIGTFHSFCFHLLKNQEGNQVAHLVGGPLGSPTAADFDDLLTGALECLQTDPELLARTQKEYRHIFVDEYQDINDIQHQLLKILIGSKNRGSLKGLPSVAASISEKIGRCPQITAIGDPNQAIYGFRGSDVKYFETFKNDFPGARVMHLSENYRSAANLLKASSQVIEKDKRFNVPALTANILKEGKLTIHVAPTDRAEAEYVVHQIERLVGGTSMFSQDSGRVESHEEAERTFGDIAVLYRLNGQRYVLEKALHRSGIPFQSSVEKEDDGPTIASEKVNLLTMHAAKGLEFPIVFLIGCEKTLLPLELENMTSNPQEERRLFYVAMTRAKERLYLTRAKRRFLFGKMYRNAPCVFLSDIEEELKNYEIIKQKLKRKAKAREKQISLFE